MSGRVQSAPGDGDSEQREVGTEGLSLACWVRSRVGGVSAAELWRRAGTQVGRESLPGRRPEEYQWTAPAPAQNGQPRGRLMGQLQGERRRRVQFRAQAPARV